MQTGRLYQPARTAMQQGQAKTKAWVLELAHNDDKQPEPIMGWVSSDDTRSQLKLRFSTKKQAMDYAKANDIKVTIIAPSKPQAHRKSYADNFTD